MARPAGAAYDQHPMPKKAVRTGKKTLAQRIDQWGMHLDRRMDAMERRMDRFEKHLLGMQRMLMDEIRDVRLELKGDIRTLDLKIDRVHAEFQQRFDTIQRFIVRIETERFPESVLALEHRVFKLD